MEIDVSLDKGPSLHLSWKELACKDGTPYPDEYIGNGRVFQLAAMFEEIRIACGNHPITVISAYRTPNWNKKVGGAKFSQHIEGRALDLLPPEGYTLEQFYTLIKANTREWGIRGLGKYKTFVHVDIRPTTKLITWRGTGVKDSGINA